MAGSGWGRIIEAVLDRPDVYRSRRRRRSGNTEPVSFSGFRPNAPRMITVLASLAATVVGLVMTATVKIQWVLDRLADANIDVDDRTGWFLLLASPLLLVAGSLFRGL